MIPNFLSWSAVFLPLKLERPWDVDAVFDAPIMQPGKNTTSWCNKEVLHSYRTPDSALLFSRGLNLRQLRPNTFELCTMHRQPIITRQYGFRMIPMCLLDDNPPQYLLVILQSVSPTIPTSEIGLGRHLLFDGGYAAEQLQQRYCATVGCSVVLVQLRGRWDKIAPSLVNLDFWWFLLVQRLDIPKAANLYDQSLHLVFFRFAFLERLRKWQEQHRTDGIAQKCGKMVSVTQQNSDDPLSWQNPVWLDTLFNGYSRAPADTAVNQDSIFFFL